MCEAGCLALLRKLFCTWPGVRLISWAEVLHHDLGRMYGILLVPRITLADTWIFQGEEKQN